MTTSAFASYEPRRGQSASRLAVRSTARREDRQAHTEPTHQHPGRYEQTRRVTPILQSGTYALPCCPRRCRHDGGTYSRACDMLRLGLGSTAGARYGAMNLFWIAVAVTVIGLFMLVAGIGPLLLPILVTLVGIVLIVVSRRQRR